MTLTSDLICRRDDLTFCSALDGETLWKLAGLDVTSPHSINISGDSVSETRVVHGYNTASGTRRSPALAIRRGSVFLVQGDDPRQLSALFTALAVRQAKGQGLGERLEEGFGRFVLNHQCHQDMKSAEANVEVPDAPAAPQENGGEMRAREDVVKRRRAQREEAIKLVLSVVGKLKVQDKTFPARTQWQWLRHRIVITKTQAEVDNVISDIREQSGKLSGAMWKTLIGALDDWRKQLTSPEQQRTFLDYLARWIVVRQDQLRRDEKQRK